MNWDDFMTAFRSATETINLADRHLSSMARMLRGRLKSSNTDASTLVALKKELAKFNMHTKEWMD